MLSKKYTLVAGLLALFSTTTLQAQDNGMYRGGNYNVLDTSLIPANRLSQARDFANNQYDFPAKPRNQWEIGISGGMLNVSGDVRSKTIFNGAIKPLNTLGWGLSVRKAWGYVISTRLQFNHGSASGFNHQAGTGYWQKAGNPWNTAGYNDMPVYYNYMTKLTELSLQVVASLNNIKYHTARSKVSYHIFAGVGGLNYKSYVDALIGSNRYGFGSVPVGPTTPWDTRKANNTYLKGFFDGTYETEGERHNNRNVFGTNSTLRAIGNFGAGAQFRLSKVVSLQIEDKITWTGDDLIDGQRWQERQITSSGLPVTSAMTRDMDNINYFSVGLNFNIGANAVSPLWWMNPNDYAYNALKSKSAPDTKCDKDADGDGISDCFDRCPNTPGGVSVDSHGCPFDTDGDGVADYKDKQLITPTECQPVDADGVGRCPEPECCKNRVETPKGCGSISSGSINFSAGSAKLASGSMSQLNSLASSMRSNPNCKAVIIGNGSGSKIEQQRSWDRVNSVINYMVDKQGIDRDRFIFQYGNSGDANSVEYRSAGAGEEGPSNTPPPFPNLRRN
jgi:hypothetical protein